MARKITDLEKKTVTFEIEGKPAEVFDLTRVDEDMLIQLALHGAKQKIGDSYANAAKQTEGTNMSIQDYIHDCVTDGIERLYNNDWTLRTGGTGGPRITDLARALAEVYNTSEDDAAEKVAEMDADTKKAARKVPQIKVVLDRLRAERATEKAEQSAAEATEAPLPDFGF